MLVQLNIEDKVLSEKISDYVGSKHKGINELVIESIDFFLNDDIIKILRSIQKN